MGAKRSDEKIRRQAFFRNPFFRICWAAIFFIEYTSQLFVKITINSYRSRVIVSDRTFYDSLIDQALNFGYAKDQLFRWLDSWIITWIFPHPQAVIYMDCDPKIAFLRKNDIPDIQGLEEREALYKQLAGRYTWITLDGTLPADEIFTRVQEVVYKKAGV